MLARILIVDDNRVVRKTLKHLLETLADVKITEAEDGQAAIARALESRPDVIILDLAMPVMDGLKAAREISKLVPETPIFMYTMHWSELLAVEAQKSGVRKLVSKSQSNILLAEVQQAIAARPPNPQPEADDPAAAAILSPAADLGAIAAGNPMPPATPDPPEKPPQKN
jgi:CheY-like chemotaxis protein